MTQLLARIRQRPLIVLTLLLILALILLDRSGFFAARRQGRLALLPIGTDVVLDGEIVSMPETKQNRTSFVLAAAAIDGRPARSRLLVTAPGTEPHLSLGDRVRLTGSPTLPPEAKNPGSFDYAAYLARQGIDAILFAASVRPSGSTPLPLPAALALAVRADMLSTLRRVLPSREAEILIPMLIGDKSGLDAGEKAAFTDAGVMHVLVVSGLNVAYCTAIFLGFFRLLGFPRRTAALLTLPFLFLYMLATGANPPVVRATVMAFFVILSLALAREPLIYQSLSLAALVILLFDPQSLFTASFQLSFAATLGIVYLYPYLLAPFKKLPPFLARTVGPVFSVSLAAQLAVLPVIAFYFNRVSLIGIVSNVIVVPLVGIVTGAGIVLYLAHFVSGTLAAGAAYLTGQLVTLLTAVVHFFARFPAAAIPIPSPHPLFIAAYYFLLWSVFRLPASRPLRPAAIAVALLCAAALLIRYHHRANELSFTFLSLPNGDAVHVRFPDGTNWLIDAGGGYGTYDPGEKIVCPHLRSRGLRRLDAVVVTHPHRHHCGGLFSVLEAVRVGAVYSGPAFSADRGYLQLCDDIQARKILWREWWAGETIRVGECIVRVLSPAVPSPDPDEASLVLLFEYRGKRALLTSDMGPAAERTLLSTGESFTADVLVLPNHGNRLLSARFISMVHPRFVIASNNKKNPRGVRGFGPARVISTADGGAATAILRKEGSTVTVFRSRAAAR